MDVERSVRVSDMVALSDISERLGVKLATVKAWGARYDSFPRPLIRGVYSWVEVRSWAGEHAPYGYKIKSKKAAGSDGMNTPSVS